MKFFLKFFLISLVLVLLIGGGIGGIGFWVLYKYGQGLPDYRQLATYNPQVMTRVHAGDGR